MILFYINLVVAALIAVTFYIEIKTGRIPNWVALSMVALFVVALVVAEDRAALLWQAGIAVLMFLAGLGLFAVGGMGAGAVKFLGATVLFIPVSEAFYALIVYFAVFFVSAIVIVQVRKRFGSEDSTWHVMAHAVLPLSLSIGAAGIAGMFFLPV